MTATAFYLLARIAGGFTLSLVVYTSEISISSSF